MARFSAKNPDAPTFDEIHDFFKSVAADYPALNDMQKSCLDALYKTCVDHTGYPLTRKEIVDVTRDVITNRHDKAKMEKIIVDFYNKKNGREVNTRGDRFNDVEGRPGGIIPESKPIDVPIPTGQLDKAMTMAEYEAYVELLAKTFPPENLIPERRDGFDEMCKKIEVRILTPGAILNEQIYEAVYNIINLPADKVEDYIDSWPGNPPAYSMEAPDPEQKNKSDKDEKPEEPGGQGGPDGSELEDDGPDL